MEEFVMDGNRVAEFDPERIYYINDGGVIRQCKLRGCHYDRHSSPEKVGWIVIAAGCAGEMQVKASGCFSDSHGNIYRSEYDCVSKTNPIPLPDFTGMAKKVGFEIGVDKYGHYHITLYRWDKDTLRSVGVPFATYHCGGNSLDMISFSANVVTGERFSQTSFRYPCNKNYTYYINEDDCRAANPLNVVKF